MSQSEVVSLHFSVIGLPGPGHAAVALRKVKLMFPLSWEPLNYSEHILPALESLWVRFGSRLCLNCSDSCSTSANRSAESKVQIPRGEMLLASLCFLDFMCVGIAGSECPGEPCFSATAELLCVAMKVSMCRSHQNRWQEASYNKMLIFFF